MIRHAYAISILQLDHLDTRIGCITRGLKQRIKHWIECHCKGTVNYIPCKTKHSIQSINKAVCQDKIGSKTQRQDQEGR